MAKRPFPREYEIEVVWKAKHKTPEIVFKYDGEVLVSAQCPLQEMLEKVEGLIEQASGGEIKQGTSTKQEIPEQVDIVLRPASESE